MAVSFGELLSGAGRIGRRGEQVGQELRDYERDRTALDESRRVADLNKQLAGLQMQSFQPLNAAQYTQQFTPGQTMPMGAGDAAPAAPVAPVDNSYQILEDRRLGRIAPAVPAQPTSAQPTSALTVQQFQAMPPAERARRLQIENDRRRIATLGTATAKFPAAAADIFTLPITGGASLLQGAANAMDFARIGRAVGLYDPDVTSVTVPFAGSNTPYMDKLSQIEAANQPLTEAQFLKQIQTRPAPAAPAAAPTQPTKRAQAFDNKVTPYDAIIQQSAVQYGIDPVVFKRLLGTESSFNPKAVSPRGEKFGLGIAQIAAVHELPREQMLDPNTAIPFAAQLFSQYVQQAGGNVEEALMRYKGATSEKGRAEMSKPIGDIVSGLTPTATAAAPAPGAAPAAAAAPGGPPTALEVPQTQARNMEMAEFYLAKHESIPYELQQVNQMAQQQSAFLTQQRNETAQLAQVYMRSGTQQGINAAMRLRESIGKFDESLLQIQQQVQQKQMYLQGMQGLRELATANDPRRLSGVLSQMLGVPVAFQPRPDGKYNHFVNGQKVAEGLTTQDVASGALRDFSPEARDATSKSAALRNELALKLQYDPGIKTAQINAIAKLYEARTKGEYDLQIKALEKIGIDVKPTGDGSGRLAIIKDKQTLLMLDTAEVKKEQTPFGEITLPPTARRVGGLNMGR